MFCQHVHHSAAWCLRRLNEGISTCPLGLEWKTVVSCHEELGTGAGSTGRAAVFPVSISHVFDDHLLTVRKWYFRTVSLARVRRKYQRTFVCRFHARLGTAVTWAALGQVKPWFIVFVDLRCKCCSWAGLSTVTLGWDEYMTWINLS